MHVTPSLSLREVAIITGSLEKRPKEASDCLMRLEELFGSLGTGNPLKIGGGKTSGLKDSDLSISIRYETASHPKVRVALIIAFSGEQFLGEFRNEGLILRDKGLIDPSSIRNGTLHRCESPKTRYNV